MQRLAWFLLFVLSCFTAQALADTLTVYPNGSGPYPTIQAAIDQSTAGDIIELADGTYTGDGNRDLVFPGHAIVLRSQSNTPSLCIIDCEGQPGEPHRAISCIGGEPAGTEVAGLSAINGHLDDFDTGSAIVVSVDSHLTVTNCIFDHCQSSAIRVDWLSHIDISESLFTSNEGLSGAALAANNCTVAISNCDFSQNTGNTYGGVVWCYGVHLDISSCLFSLNTGTAIDINDPASPANTISDCLFIDNVSLYGASAISMFCGVETDITNCTFIGNSDGSGYGTIYSDKISDTLVRNCTFWRNIATEAVLVCGHQLFEIENTIVAGTLGGAAVHASYYMPILSCANLWDNEGGDWTSEIEDQFGINGNISGDPLFCDPDATELTIDMASPCAPYSAPDPECDLIGAWPVDCGTSAVGASTWGGIKNLYR